nr:uncharacterized protein LOC105863453 isoform X1 [Microcebus murinus]XP_012605977.1 uncharacterized protein LOC105863453 isoform X1 [Microcebus murinus]
MGTLECLSFQTFFYEPTNSIFLSKEEEEYQSEQDLGSTPVIYELVQVTQHHVQKASSWVFLRASATSFLSLFLPGALKKVPGSGLRRHPVLHRRRNRGREVAMNVDHEVNLLVEEIHHLGSKNADGKLSVKFGVLFRDDKCANLFEALVGTLKAAKRRKIVMYPGELLLQGVHDNVDIILLQD